MKYDFDIYTDGSCSNNPGPGAYSFIILKSEKIFYKSSCGFLLTTNNRMELLGVIEALSYIKSNCEINLINVFSDSKYVTDTFNKNWISNWKKKNFKGVLNVDLWFRYLEISKDLNIIYNWVPGHTGNFYNEECNKSAINEVKHGNLIVDTGYKPEQNIF